ncbi:MAG: WG repeat-containing protein [Dialister sp.]|nr:WG repeat-containing protein [Dialister sp.]
MRYIPQTLLLATCAALSLAAMAHADNSALPFAAAAKSGGKWGVINRTGKVVIPIMYDKVALSLADEKHRAADLEGDGRKNFIEVSQGSLRGFYNREGKQIVPLSYKSRSVWNEGYLAVQGENKKIGFYKNDGTKIAPFVYDEVSDFENGHAIVKSGSRYGYINGSGKEIAPVYKEARYFEYGAAPVLDEAKNLWGVINEKGKYIAQPSYKATGPSYSDGLLAVQNKNTLWGFIDTEGNEVVKPIYKAVIPRFSEGYTAVQEENNLWGFIDAKGNRTADAKYKAVYTPFSEGLAGVKTTDGNGYVTPDGTLAFMADYDKLYPFDDGLAEVREGVSRDMVRKRGLPISIGIGWGWGHWFYPHHHHFGLGIGFPVWGWDPWYDDYYYERMPVVEAKRGYIDHDGKVIASTSNDVVYPMTDKGVLVKNDKLYGWISRDGKYTVHVIYKNLIPLTEENVLLAQKDDQLWGLIAMDDGKELTSFSFDELQDAKSGFIAYKEGKKWGLMDTGGKRLTKAMYNKIGKGSDGRIPAKGDDGWIYLDENGREAFRLTGKVQDMKPFLHGLGAVKINGKWGLVTPDGTFAVTPAYDDLRPL